MIKDELEAELQRLDEWFCSDAIKEVVRDLLRELHAARNERDAIKSWANNYGDDLPKCWAQLAAMEQDLLEARAENARFRAALEFYAGDWDKRASSENPVTNMEWDSGDRARQALSTPSGGAALLEAIRGIEKAVSRWNRHYSYCPCAEGVPCTCGATEIDKALSTLKAAMGETDK